MPYTPDAYNIDRTAQPLVVEYQSGSGSPPVYTGRWLPLWQAEVESITLNHGARPSQAVVTFPTLRWHQGELNWGDRSRIRTDHPQTIYQRTIFSGFVTRYRSEFTASTGSADSPGRSGEQVSILCLDHRWLLAATSPLYGQLARGPDDYDNYGTSSQTAKTDRATFLTGRRIIFNPEGRPNRAPVPLQTHTPGGEDYEIYIFCNPGSPANPAAEYWTAGHMVGYIMSHYYNLAAAWLPVYGPSALTVLEADDWQTVLHNVTLDTLPLPAALEHICKQIGWCFREDYDADGYASFAFYQLNSASGFVRSASEPAIRHELHAPAVDEDIRNAVAAGRKMLYAMTFDEDMGGLVNNPWAIGAPHRFEFTAELVPAWLDSELTPDTSDSNANLYFTAAARAEMANPDAKDYYKYYHSRGSAFRRDVGRKWALNETGTYSPTTTYNRGLPFDFSTVLPAGYILDGEGYRLFAPFSRALLPCLTFDKDSLSPLEIRVEFSFDSGATWQSIPCVIANLSGEAGLRIDEPNLADILPKVPATISGGDLDGVELNYWTSLADDSVNSRSFKDGNWHTRLRVTASVQMDQRLASISYPTSRSGSPFRQAAIYDFSSKYTLQQRCAASSLYSSGLPAWNTDETDQLAGHLEHLRDVNEDMSISGEFTLDRLWLYDTVNNPEFAVGDSITRITGRGYDLSVSFGGGILYPEIIQITYLPPQQKMRLITRDLRFAEMQ